MDVDFDEDGKPNIIQPNSNISTEHPRMGQIRGIGAKKKAPQVPAVTGGFQGLGYAMAASLCSAGLARITILNIHPLVSEPTRISLQKLTILPKNIHSPDSNVSTSSPVPSFRPNPLSRTPSTRRGVHHLHRLHAERQIAYNASNAGVIHMMKSFAASGQSTRISPGHMQTELGASLDPNMVQHWIKSTPMSRMGLLANFTTSTCTKRQAQLNAGQYQT
ncbi:uncharacterized protein V1513DRAFT_427976 [Lipomyces chichibuensis]|uniref:uncharacterized protein n=1 Tax=Lipomyces chichibuensis TaxID=1546026 RepID=UPI00334325DC